MWTGLKKCIPTTRSGLRAPSAISVIESEEVFEAKMKAPRAGNPLDFAQRLALQLKAFGHGLDEEVAGGGLFEVGRAADVREHAVALLFGDFAALDAFGQVRFDGAQARARRVPA